jgi:hypothetical protein
LRNVGARRHHWVPRFLLKRFADDRNTLQVVTHDSPSRTFRASVDNLAVENGFYYLHMDTGESRDDLERHLSEMEGQAASAIRILESDHGEFGPSERRSLLFFVAWQLARGPRVRAATRRAAFQRAGVDADDFRAAVERWVESWLHHLDEKPSRNLIRHLANDLVEQTMQGVELDNNSYLYAAFQVLDDVLAHPQAGRTRRVPLLDLEVGHYSSPASRVLCSDEPVVPLVHRGRRRRTGPLGTSLLIMPVSPRTVLLFGPDLKDRLRYSVPVGHQAVITPRINSLIADTSDRYIFHNPQDVPVYAMDEGAALHRHRLLGWFDGVELLGPVRGHAPT